MGGYNSAVLDAMSSVSICAVNVFVIITGYFSCMSYSRNVGKISNLLIQLIFYRLLFHSIANILNNRPILSLNELIGCVIPNNYFVILYLTLFLISPYINKLITCLSKNDYKKMLIFFFILFSIIPFVVDILFFSVGPKYSEGLSTVSLRGGDFGYNIINFSLLYIIGAYLRIHSIKLRNRQNFFGFIIASCFVYFGYEIETKLSTSANVTFGYHSPFVILQAMFLFMFFSKLKFKSGAVNELSKAAFTCYLIQSYFLGHLRITYFINQQPYITMLHEIGSAIIIYLLSYVAYKIYNKTLGRVTDRITYSINYYE